MTITYGLTAQGLVIKTLDVIRGETEASLQVAFGASVPLGDMTLLGQVNGIYSEREALLWELLEQVYSAFDPLSSTGQPLISLSAITGTLPLPETPSEVVLTLTGTPATTVPAGNLAETSSTSSDFMTSADATIAALTAWAGTTAYSAAAPASRVTNGGNAYVCTTSGTSAGSGGPTSTLSDITDGSAHWRFMGTGTGAVDVASQSVADGPVVGVSGDISVIKTPVFGWDGVINLLDASLGTLTESDSALRIRRSLELTTSGSTPQDAIRADMLQITGTPSGDVTSCTVFANDTDYVDANGMPPHSVQVLVRTDWSPSTDADQILVDTIFASVAGGITTFGTSFGTVTDSEGQLHTIYFSRPAEVDIYVADFVDYDPELYPLAGDALIQAAIATYGAAQATGKDAVPSAVGAQAFGVPGVTDSLALIYTDVIAVATPWVATTAYVATPGGRSVVTSGGRTYICVTSGTSGSTGPLSAGTDIVDGSAHWYYLGNTIPISLLQLAVFDTSRTTIFSTPVTP